MPDSTATQQKDRPQDPHRSIEPHSIHSKRLLDHDFDQIDDGDRFQASE